MIRAAIQCPRFHAGRQRRVQDVRLVLQDDRNSTKSDKSEQFCSQRQGREDERPLTNKVRCILFGCGLALGYRGYAAKYAAYVLNRMFTRANTGRKCPIEILTGKPASVICVVILGSPCTLYRNPKKKYLTKRGTPGIIVGKSDETKGFRVLLPNLHVVVTTIHVRQIKTLNIEANE